MIELGIQNIMKYQDSETRSQYSKIQSLLSRFEPSVMGSQMKVQYTSRSTLRSQQSLRPIRIQQEKLNPLMVDIVHHSNHNILDPPSKTCTRERLRIHRYSKPTLSKTSSKLSRFTASTKNSFRVKKALPKQLETNKQNRSLGESTEFQFHPLLMESKILKEETNKEQNEFRKKKGVVKHYQNKEEIPDIMKYLAEHRCLGEFEGKCRVRQEKVVASGVGAEFGLIKHLVEEKPVFLKEGVTRELLECENKQVGFLLTALYSRQPQIIKRLFGKYQDGSVKLVINYEGCFRAIPVQYLPLNREGEFLKSKEGSLWPRILNHVIETLMKGRSSRQIKVKEVYEMVTGLVMEEVNICETSQERLLEILSSLKMDSQMIIGETYSGQSATIQAKPNSFLVKRYLLEAVCSEFQPKAPALIQHLIQHYKVLRILDLSPDYYFLYRQIQYSLGTDSSLKLTLQQPITLTLQISKQTIAFDGKIKLSLQQRREEGVEQIYSEMVHSFAPLKKELTLLPGNYTIRLNDNKENIKEYRFPVVLGVVCKRNITGGIRRE